jgi:hypothetical protein
MRELDKWDNRRLQLVLKQAKVGLTSIEQEELELMERCVDYCITNEFPRQRITNLERLLEKLKEVGLDL